MRLNSGDIAPRTGKFQVVDSNGNVLDREGVEVQKGQRLPATQSSDYHYEINE